MWTDDRVSDLKRWVSEGLSGGQIEKAFAGLFSRRAVTSKAARMGLKLTGHLQKPAKPKPEKVDKAPQEVEALDTQDYQPKPLLQRVWGKECGYLVNKDGEEPMACCAPQWEGGSAGHVYCRKHFKQCYTAPQVRIRARGSW